ncbi:MAG: hypothetical protein HQL32_05895 [Planctomycetes bacterium]|nr:hypothetical protein [Planctomycetota bacterium]
MVSQASQPYVIKKATSFLAVLLLAILLTSSSPIWAQHHSEYVVIAPKGFPIKEVTLGELKKLYTGIRTKIHKKHVKFVLWTEDPKKESQYLQEIFDLSRTQFRSLWKKHLFLGNRQYPQHFEKQLDVISKVAESTNILAIVHKNMLKNEQVIIVKIKEYH